MRCPTSADVMSAVLALLPRGRAWQTNEGGPMPGRETGFNPAAFNPDAFSTERAPKSILYQYWRAYSEVLHFVTQRLCDLRKEFWCQSISETRDEWMTEYGLPDACDPFPDLCSKVAAIGGTRCEYYAAIAARSGWSIDCRDLWTNCSARAGCAKAGCMRPGNRRAGGVVIVVYLDQSPAFAGTRHAKPKAGRLRAGRRLACGPDLLPLQCIMARIVHAEVKTVYEVK